MNINNVFDQIYNNLVINIKQGVAKNAQKWYIFFIEEYIAFIVTLIYTKHNSNILKFFFT